MIQTIILGMILVVLVIILVTIVYYLRVRSPGVKGDIIMEEGGSNNNRIDLEQKIKGYGDGDGGEFDKERQKAIEDLRLFALEKMEKEKTNNKLKGSPEEIRVNGQGTGPVTSGKEYIPYNLNERDKTILRMFNG